jgi:predicted nucleic acid-binding Zn ribbon protein
VSATGKAARVGELLPGVLEGLGLGGALTAAAALAAWRRVVGERMARVADARSLAGGVLTVEVESSVWMQEIGFHKVRILKRLEDECGAGVVRDLKLVLRRAP